MIEIAEPATWRKSSYCNGAACVEVLITGSSVRIRDSKTNDGQELKVERQSWINFVEAIKVGVFDDDDLGDQRQHADDQIETPR